MRWRQRKGSFLCGWPRHARESMSMGVSLHVCIEGMGRERESKKEKEEERTQACLMYTC